MQSMILKYNFGKVEILFNQIKANNSKTEVIVMIYLQSK